MKTYRISALWEYFKIITLDVKAASDAAAKKKFRKRVNGSVTNLRVEEVSTCLVWPKCDCIVQGEKQSDCPSTLNY